MRNIPEIRFKGFTDAWGQCEFLCLVNRLSQQSDADNLPKVEFEDIVSGEGVLNKDVSCKFDNRKGIVFEPGNILFGKLRPYLKNWLFADFKGVALGDFWVFEANDVAPLFIYYLIQTEQYQEIANLSTGTKMPRSDWKTVSEHIFSIPSEILEQATIGKFFRTLDTAINLHKRKLDKLKELKNGYLQWMFPQSGENVPQLRFAGFTGDWVKRRLGDESDILAGGDIDKDKISVNGKYPVYANALTNDGIVGYYENNFHVEAPAVTVTGRGDVGYAKARKVNFTPVVRLLAVKSEHDVDFLENAINNHNVFVESTGVPQLTIPQLAKYTILFPNFPEQTAIGSFFHNLDEYITAQMQKLEQLKKLKSAYLQKMFI